jgi:hypothetical protein
VPIAAAIIDLGLYVPINMLLILALIERWRWSAAAKEQRKRGQDAYDRFRWLDKRRD